MKRNFILTITFFLLVLSGNAQVYKISKPLLNQGKLYDAILHLKQEKSTGNTIAATMCFRLLCGNRDSYNLHEKNGGYQCITKNFAVNKNSNSIELSATEDYSSDDALGKINKVLVNIRPDKLVVQIGLGRDKQKLEFYKRPYDGEEPDYLLPASYIDEESLNYKHTKADNNDNGTYLQVTDNSINYIPHFAGDVTARAFPENGRLINLLKSNHDFVFKLTKDLYLDIYRFKTSNEDYTDEQVINFLQLHDLWFFKYERDPDKLQKKIRAFYKLMRIASTSVNLGEIYYKDFKVDVSQLNKSAINILNLSDEDDYYGTKKIMGFRDNYYLKNALSIYLSNWAAVNSIGKLDSDTSALANALFKNQKSLTLRTYFLLQPVPAISAEGEYKGTTAYALRSVLYDDCPNKPLANIDNKYINQVSDPVVRRCFLSAYKFLNETKYPEVLSSLKLGALKEGNFKELHLYTEPHENCEVGYYYLTGQVYKAEENTVIKIRLKTNYNCTIQPGYELAFVNRNTDVSISLPINNVKTRQTEKNEGYFEIELLTDKKTMQKLVNANVNSLIIQTQGEPRYKSSNTSLYINPTAVISKQLDKITVPLDVSISGRADKFIQLLKQGL